MPKKDGMPPEQNGHDAEMSQDESAVELLATPEGNSDRQPSIGEAIGIGSGSQYDDNIIAKIYEGAAPLIEWGPRGRRTRNMILSEVDVFVENEALSSPHFRIRADYMAKVLRGDSYRSLFGPAKREMNGMEIGGLIIFGVAICAMLFLVATVYA